VDELMGGLGREVRNGVREQMMAWLHLATRLTRVRPSQRLKQRREVLTLEGRRLHELARQRLQAMRTAFQTANARLRLLGPEQVLARGYSITMDAATGEILREAGSIKRGQRIRTRLKSGELRSVVGD